MTWLTVSTQSTKEVRGSGLWSARHRQAQVLLGQDEAVYRPAPATAARQVLGLPEDARVIVFGCFNLADPRKGMGQLLEALQVLRERLDEAQAARVLLLTLGNAAAFGDAALPFRWHHLGRLYDDRSVALAYQAGDVFACPSLDDVGPMMVNEAYACGRPVVAFRQGVAPDIILGQGDGYLAELGDAADFAEGLYRAVLGELPGPDDVARRRVTASHTVKELEAVLRESIEATGG